MERHEVEHLLAEEAARVLRPPDGRLPVDRPLTGFGLDSLAAVELRAAVEARLGAAPPLGDLLEGASIEELAAELAAGPAADLGVGLAALERAAAAAPRPVPA